MQSLLGQFYKLFHINLSNQNRVSFVDEAKLTENH